MGNTPSSASPLIRPPMKIHQIHGKNLTISPERLQAKRHEGYSDGLFFGSRPAFPKEQLEITVNKIISEWNGALRFGFTTHNPIAINNHPEGIPRYMCPDLIKRGGSYVETISQISLRAKDKIVFWLEPTGEVSLKVNEVMQKCQLHGINKDVWPVIDVYGNTVEVSFRSLDDNMDHINPPSKPRYYSSLRLAPFQICANVESVDFFDENTVRKTNSKKAYVWNKIPLQINTVWVLFVNEVDHSIGTNMSIAISKMSPQINRLPENFSEFSRGNGWIFENVYTRMMPGDELAICILDNGVILVAINGEKFETLGKVHPSQFYWLVTDISCSVTSLASVGIYKMTRYPLPILPVIENFSDLDIQTSPSSLPNIGATGGDFKKSQSLLRESSMSKIGREESFLTPESERNSSEFFRERKTECVICLDSVPDNVFIPCGHVCCCKACADNLMNEHGNILCPACRVKIEFSYKVFL